MASLSLHWDPYSSGSVYIPQYTQSRHLHNYPHVNILYLQVNSGRFDDQNTLAGCNGKRVVWSDGPD